MRPPLNSGISIGAFLIALWLLPMTVLAAVGDGEPDFDNDCLSDNDEFFLFGTDSADADTDDDGFEDGDEVGQGTNPLDANSRPDVPRVIISEIMADNETVLQDEDGDYSDWIELHNPTAAAIDLDEWALTDDPADLTKWEFPDAIIPAGGFLVVFASDKNRLVAKGEMHTNFRLNNSGEFLALVMSDGVTVATQFLPEYPFIDDDKSYGLPSNSNSMNYLQQPTPGAANSTTVPDPEIEFFAGSPLLINAGESATLTWSVAGADQVNITNAASGLPLASSWTVSPTVSTDYVMSAVASGTSATATVRIVVRGQVNNFAANPGQIFPGGATVLDWDTVSLAAQDLSVSPHLGLPAGPPTVAYPTNTQWIDRGADWKYYNNAAAPDPPPNWAATDYDDSTWPAGTAPFGTANLEAETVLDSSPVTSFFRKEFTVANPALVRGLVLRARLRDGIVVHINGDEAGRFGMPFGPVTNSTKAQQFAEGLDILVYQQVPLDTSLLVAGENVIAIEVHKFYQTGGFAFFDASLDGWIHETNTTHVFSITGVNEGSSTVESISIQISDPVASQPPLARIAITEIHTSPPETTQDERQAGFWNRDWFRFIEVQNIGDSVVDLRGIQLTGSAWFDFTGATPSRLAPGAYGIVAANRAAFEFRHGPDLPVLGEYKSSEATRVGLLDRFGRWIEKFEYTLDAPWPSAAQNEGFTIRRINTAGDPADPSNWETSRQVDGSPGESRVPQVVDFSVNPPLAKVGDTVTLTWAVEDAASIEIDQDVGEVSQSSGSIDLVIQPGEGSRTFTLTAFSAFGQDGASVDLVVAPQIRSFTASDTSVPVGAAGVALSWELNTPDATVTLDPGGTTAGGNGIFISPQNPRLIDVMSEWKFKDDGLDYGTTWREAGIDDSDWFIGPGIFGFGNNNENTILNRFAPLGEYVFVWYFRREFELDDPSALLSATVELLRDDGAEVYLNGQEIIRDNLPKGVIDYQTLANAAVGGANESEYHGFPIDVTAFQAGTNLIAVGIHNVIPGGEDASFDLGLRVTRTVQPATRVYTITASNEAGSASASIVLLFDRDPVSFLDWTVAENIAGQGPEDDGDGDMLSNLFEFASGTSPTDPSSLANPIVTTDSDGHAVLTFSQNLLAENLRFYPEFSTDLQTWKGAASGLEYSRSTIEDPSGTVALTSYRTALPASSYPALYLRLRIEQLP